MVQKADVRDNQQPSIYGVCYDEGSETMCAESAILELMVSIYILIDPRSGDIRYVGKTKQTLKDRYGQHLKTARRNQGRNWRNHWINQLLRLGYRPRMELIQVVPMSDWRKAEQYWIGYFRSVGCRLTNGDEGGEGGDSFTPEARANMSMAAIRKFQNPEIKAKYMGNQNSKGREMTAELRTNLTKGQFNRYGYPWENLKDDYERLGTCGDVAEVYGCDPEVVRRNLNRLGIKANGFCLPKGEHTEEWLARWANLEADYIRLGTQRAVANEYGTTQQQVQKAMKALSIIAMPRARPRKQAD